MICTIDGIPKGEHVPGQHVWKKVKYSIKAVSKFYQLIQCYNYNCYIIELHT